MHEQCDDVHMLDGGTSIKHSLHRRGGGEEEEEGGEGLTCTNPPVVFMEYLEDEAMESKLEHREQTRLGKRSLLTGSTWKFERATTVSHFLGLIKGAADAAPEWRAVAEELRRLLNVAMETRDFNKSIRPLDLAGVTVGECKSSSDRAP